MKTIFKVALGILAISACGYNAYSFEQEEIARQEETKALVPKKKTNRVTCKQALAVLELRIKELEKKIDDLINAINRK
ncbi:MAG: hypothetical protein LBM19_01035 [Holosporales bacterium]|nr:hypothetical protein [Holosporales bacterium]